MPSSSLPSLPVSFHTSFHNYYFIHHSSLCIPLVSCRLFHSLLHPPFLPILLLNFSPFPNISFSFFQSFTYDFTLSLLILLPFFSIPTPGSLPSLLSLIFVSSQSAIHCFPSFVVVFLLPFLFEPSIFSSFTLFLIILYLQSDYFTLSSFLTTLNNLIMFFPLHFLP